jgi:hypothetical protein
MTSSSRATRVARPSNDDIMPLAPFDTSGPTFATVSLHDNPPGLAELTSDNEDEEDLLDDEHIGEFYTTALNEFGTYRRYPCVPTVDPDADVPLESVTDTPVVGSPAQQPSWWSGMSSSLLGLLPEVPYAPFSSPSTYRLFQWFYQSEAKSLSDLTSLINNVLLAPDFDIDDPSIQDFNIDKELRQLDESEDFAKEDGWTAASIEIPVPIKGEQISEDDTPYRYKIPGLYYRKLVGVITNFFTHAKIGSFHLTPFQLFWESAAGAYEQIFLEVYNSDAMFNEHIKLLKDFSNSQYEIVIAAILLWSDSTHLANFGTASLWPVYLFFGNVSKYVRGKPTSFMAQHIAYLPKACQNFAILHGLYLTLVQLPADFDQFYMNITGKAPPAALKAHMRRELFHALWYLMLDDDFVRAYAHGIVIKFADGIERLVFPRIFSYSADYPEKFVLYRFLVRLANLIAV